MMMRNLLLFSLLSLSLLAGEFRLDHFETSLLDRKGHTPVTVRLTVVLQGRDVSPSTQVQLQDVVQTVLGSFWAETLLTSQGKEKFKKMVIARADAQYGLEVDFVYLLDVVVETDTLQKCLEMIREGERLLR